MHIHNKYRVVNKTCAPTYPCSLKKIWNHPSNYPVCGVNYFHLHMKFNFEFTWEVRVGKLCVILLGSCKDTRAISYYGLIVDKKILSICYEIILLTDTVIEME